MKKSTVIIVIAVIAALIVIWGIQNVIKNRQKLTPGGDFVKILPLDMRAADVHKVEIYAGDARKDAVVLARGKEGWTIPSRFNSKADEKSINDLLDEIKKLTGELRTRKKSLHPDFDITDEKAVHIALYKEEGKPYRELLLGKKGERWGEGFVRFAGSNKVYLADKNLRSTLGMYAEDAKPEAKKWLDLKIVDEKSEEIARVALDMPGKHLLLEKREKKKPEGEEKPTAPEEKEEEKKEYEWVLVEPEIDFKLKESTVKSVVSSVSQLKGDDVADPAKMDEYGFASPTYTATITMDDETTETILVGEKTEEDNKRYAMRKDATTVYVVPGYTVTNVFKKMRDFVEIEIWDFKKEDIASVSLKRPEYEILLQPKEGSEGKESKDWVLAKPETRFTLKSYRIDSILSRVTKPSPDDLFVKGELQTYGLDDPQFKAVVKMKDDSTRVLNFGKTVEDGEDRYVKFEGKDHVYSFTKWNFDDLFPTLPKLLTIPIMDDLKKDDIVTLNFDTTDEDFLLTAREETGKKKWSVKVGEEEADAKSNVVDDILDTITGITPEEMAIARSASDCGLDEPADTLAVSTRQKADQYTILFGKEVSEGTGNRYFKIKTEPEVFILSRENLGKIFKELKDLRLEKPAEPKEEKKPPAEEEVAPSAEEPPALPPTEKPGAPEKELQESPEKKEEKLESAPSEKAPGLKEEVPAPVPPEKEAPPAPKPEGEKGEGKEPSAPEKEELAPKPPAEKPSLEKPEKDLPPLPVPKPPGPKKPLPLPPTPESD
jgi:hypothetical protein